MKFVDTTSVSPTAETLIVIGTQIAYKEHLSWVSNVVIPKLRPTGDSVAVEESALKRAKIADPLDEIVGTLKPSKTAGASTEHWITRLSNVQGPASGPKPLRVVFCVLPPSQSVSRHNSPAQPRLVTSLFKSNCRPSELTVVSMLSESHLHLLCDVCSVAKGAGIAYQRKSSGDGIQCQVPATNEDILSLGANVEFLSPPVFSIAPGVKFQYDSLVNGILLTRRLVDMPPNELTTTAFVEQALETVKGLLNVTVSVVKGEELREKGYGGIYGVGKCSTHPPALVTLSYTPPTTVATVQKPSIVMVGKGITYDTGGLSLKPKTGMPGMKRDMGGAAAVLSAFVCAVKASQHRQALHLEQAAKSGIEKMYQERPIHACLCIAENSIGSVATRPDDIHTLYSGKTVEINNTDAEGRLVLADGVANAVTNLNPQYIIDMATLTGAQGVATGKNFAALYCSDESLEQLATRAGRESGDLCHPCPYAPEFFVTEFKSKFADLKNSVKDRSNAQVSAAAQFIGENMGNFCTIPGNKWLHIDMAYPSFDSKDELATGYGVALLFTILKQIDEDERSGEVSV